MALSIVLSVAALLFAALFKALAESCAHGKNRWGKSENDFWGHDSWRRKWKYPTTPAPNTHYYKFFKLRYQERFPGSATIFVSFTDGYHLSFSLMVTCACIAVIIPTQFPYPLWSFCLLRLLWGITWTLGYKFFSR